MTPKTVIVSFPVREKLAASKRGRDWTFRRQRRRHVAKATVGPRSEATFKMPVASGQETHSASKQQSMIAQMSTEVKHATTSNPI